MRVQVAAGVSTIAMSRRLCALGAANRTAGPGFWMTGPRSNSMIPNGTGMNSLATSSTWISALSDVV